MPASPGVSLCDCQQNILPKDSGEAAGSFVTSPFEMTAKAGRGQRRDSVTIEVTVTNTTNEPIGWDRSFESFLRFGIYTDSGDEITFARLDEVPTDEWKGSERFFLLRPHESYARKIVLTDRVRQFLFGSALVPTQAGVARDVPIGGEEYRRAIIPSTAEEISIQVVWFGPSSNVIMEESFKKVFGHLPSDLKIPYQYADARIRVRFQDGR
jgi:hypothetical protein